MSFFDDNEDRIIYGRPRHHRQQEITCKNCGATDLKWRAEGGNWVLYENKRIEHNRLKPHRCDETTVDDFDVIE